MFDVLQHAIIQLLHVSLHPSTIAIKAEEVLFLVNRLRRIHGMNVHMKLVSKLTANLNGGIFSCHRILDASNYNSFNVDFVNYFILSIFVLDMFCKTVGLMC